MSNEAIAEVLGRDIAANGRRQNYRKAVERAREAKLALEQTQFQRKQAEEKLQKWVAKEEELAGELEKAIKEEQDAFERKDEESDMEDTEAATDDGGSEAEENEDVDMENVPSEELDKRHIIANKRLEAARKAAEVGAVKQAKAKAMLDKLEEARRERRRQKQAEEPRAREAGSGRVVVAAAVPGGGNGGGAGHAAEEPETPCCGPPFWGKPVEQATKAQLQQALRLVSEREEAEARLQQLGSQ